MNFRRAIFTNVAIYFATLVLASVALSAQGKPLHFTTPPTGHQIFIALVIGMLLTTLGAIWFFRKEPGSAKAGWQFGVTAILIGFGLDVVLSAGIWTQGRNPLLFLQSPIAVILPILMLAVLLGITAMIGKVRAKQKA